MTDLPPIVEASILGDLGQRIRGISESTRLRVRDAIGDGLDDGLGARDLGKLIEDSAAFKPYRSELIARTETNRVLNVSQISTFKHYGVEQVEAIDGDSDAECIARNGRVVTVAEAMNIEDHPNGTLDWAPLTLTQEPNPTPPAPPDLMRQARQMVPRTPTTEQAEALLKRAFPDASIENIGKMHKSMRGEVVSILDDLAVRYPEVTLDRIAVAPAKRATAKVVGRTPMVRNAEGRLVEGRTRVELILDSKTFRGPKSLKTASDAYAAAEGWTVWPESWSFLRKTLTHEFGHAVDQRRFGGTVNITRGVAAPSRYAKTRDAEFWAEAFVEYEAGLNTAASRAVAERLR